MAGLGFPTLDLPVPTVDPSAIPAGSRSNAVVAGIKSGGYGLLGAGAGALSGLSKIAGADVLSQELGQKAQQFNADAQEVGRPDIDQQGWTGGGVGGFLSKLGYTAGQALPGIALAGLGAFAAPEVLGLGALGAAGEGAELGVGATALGRAGAALPRWIGGGGLGLGAGAASAEELAAGARLSAGILGAGAVTVPQSYGEQVNEAAQAPGGLTRGAALRAAVQAVPVGLAQTLVPAGGGAILRGGEALLGQTGGGLLAGVLDHGVKNAAAGAIGSGLQTAADLSFDPTKSLADKAQEVVHAAAGGAVAGGLMGGAFGLFGRRSPAETDAYTDATLAANGLDPESPRTPPPAPPPLEPPPPAQQQPPLQGAPAGVQGPNGLQSEAATAVAPLEGAAPASEPEATLQDILKAPEPPPPNALAQQVVKDAGIRIGRGRSDFKDFIANSTATSPAELYNELLAVPPDSKLADSSGFQRLVARMGVGEPDLEGDLARAKANPDTPATEISRLNYQIGLRDAAQQLRDQQAAALAGQVIPNISTPEETIPERAAADVLTPSAVPSDTDAKAAAERASPAIQTLGPITAERVPPDILTNALQTPAGPADVAPIAPQSIAEKVISAARNAVGDKGGEVDIASIRAALPDVAAKDIDNALREIHADDTDNTLVQNPKGQRTGVDGVSVPGSGRFHKLDVAPQGTPDAVQVGSAAPQVVGDQSQGGAGVRGGDAAWAAAGEAAPQVEAGPSGAQEPAQEEGSAVDQPQVARTVATAAKLAPADPAARSPEQAVQTASKAKATENVLAAPPAVQEAGRPVTVRLRKQTRARTAMVETPAGVDQVPTAAVGGDVSELPQAQATSTDPIPFAGPAEPMAKMPFDRMPGIADAAPVVPRAQLDAHIARFVAKLRPDVQDKVHIFDTADRHSDLMKDAARHAGLDLNSTTAIFHQGEVFIHADQVRSLAEAEDVLSHEIFGHLATSQRFARASDYQSAMARVFDRAGGAEGIERLARERGVWDAFDDGHNLNGGTGLKAYLPPVEADRMQGRRVQGAAGLGDYAPLDARTLTPAYKTRIVDELIAHAAAVDPTPFDSAVGALQARFRTAIVNTLRRAGLHNFAARLDRFGQADLSKWVADSRRALARQPRPGDLDLAAGATDPRQFIHDAEPLGEPPFLAKLSGPQRDTQGLMGLVGSLRDRINGRAPERPGVKDPLVRERLGDAARTVVDNIAPATHFVEQGKRLGMSGLEDHFLAGAEVQAPIRTRIDGVSNPVAQAHMDLKSADPVQEARLNRVMDVATSNNLDPLRPFDQHTWLHDGRPADDIEKLRMLHADLVKEYNKLGTPGKGGVRTNGQQIFKDHVAVGQMNWYMRRAAQLHYDLSTVFKDQVDPGYDPSRRFAGLDDAYRDASGRQLANDHFGDVGKSLTYWKGEFDRLQALAEQHAVGEGSRPENVGSRPYVDLAAEVRNNKLGEEGYVRQGPYFRRGRSGDYAVSFRIRPMLDAEGRPTDAPDPEALQAIKASYGRDFPQVSIGSSDGNRSLFARFPSQEIANQFAARVQDGGALRRFIDQDHGTRVSLLTDAQELDGAVPFLEQHVDAATAKFDAELRRMDPASEEYRTLAAQRDRYIGTLRATILDLSGDNSMRSIQSRRENVQGSNADMLENQKAAAATFSRAVSSLAVREAKAEGLAQARDAIAQAERSQTKAALGRAVEMKRILNAYEDRNTAADVRVDNNALSWIKAKLHTFTLGGSPAYIIMNTSQLGTLGLPEFAKFHGFARSTAAMTGALADTGKVLAAMVRTGGAVEGGITNDVLRLARLGADKTNFLADLVNHDHIELGSYTAVNSGLGVGNMTRFERWQQYANATALLAETASRLVMAFAAKRLYETIPEGSARRSMLRQFPDVRDYAGHVIPETMLRWGSYNTPKLFTAGGAFGKFGPLVTQFHGFVPRLVEKIYREAADGFTSRLGIGPEADAMRAEARRFTLYHLAAVTAISGGLGLPMAGYAAGAATRLSGLFLDQPYDFEANLRGFLAETFGKDLGEILAHGVPRYLGADMADLGDDNFAPLSRLMEDRRKLEDAVPEYLAHAWGSAPSAALNMALGVREMLEGRFSEAGARALPTVLRNFVRAYRVDQYGYTTASGEKLPVPADALEVLKTALGVEGGAMAEERERQDTLQGLKDDRQYRAGLIKKDLALAIMKGDGTGRQAAIDAARRYDQDNPGERLTASLPGFLQSRARAVALAQQTGTLGVNPIDRVARELTNY